MPPFEDTCLLFQILQARDLVFVDSVDVLSSYIQTWSKPNYQLCISYTL
jgi:hypothetical protein